ncbi:MAG: hypothetical protein ACOX0C_02145 [Patescibacteria group bacterium]
MTIFEKIIIVSDLILTFIVVYAYGADGIAGIITDLIISFFLAIVWPSGIWPDGNEKNRNYLVAKFKIFIKFYLFFIVKIITGFFVALILLLAGLLLLNLFRFIIFTNLRKAYKKIINRYVAEGLSLFEAINNDFEKLNKSRNLNLQTDTIEKVSHKIAELQKIMDIDNVAEVYSAFLFWHIFKSKVGLSPNNLSDQKIILASENMKFNEKNGYYVLKSYRN